jgi:hypothetical protein
MALGVRWYLVGSVVLGVLGVLAGCSGGGWFAERESWRHEAEVQCLESGAVREGAGIVRIKAIHGPGMCGADFPLKVSILGEGGPLGYTDDLRPPGSIPTGSGPSRWPPVRTISPPSAAIPEQPISLNPPSVNDPTGSAPDNYDFRRPYGAPPPAPLVGQPRSRVQREPLAGSPREDLSPEPYERRRLVDAPPGSLRGVPPSVSRAPLSEPPRASMRETVPVEVARPREPPPAVPLGPARGGPITASISPVSVSPPATLACPIVSELERWFANVVQPAALRWFGAPVAEIKQISAYSCRGMNGNPNAKISEHAFGNALDIASFTLADGRTISVKNGWRGLPEEQGFLRDVQGAACDQFTTVLAPGSNVYHYDHIHVDLMRRSSGYRVCNPHAVSGEEVAARAGSRYAARRAGEASVTGSVAPRRLPSPPKRLRSSDDDMRYDNALPLAEPGNDGED